MSLRTKGSAVVATGLAAVALATAAPTAAHAASSSNSASVPYGTLYVSAYECNTYVTSCSWYTKVQLQNSSKVMDSITNTTKISSNGLKATVNISKKEASATITGNQTPMVTVRWTKYVSNLVELHGEARPSWTAVGITTQACMTGNGPGSYGALSGLCAKIGLW